MLFERSRSLIAIGLVVAVPGTGVIAGCAEIERRTGIGTEAQTGAAAGGAAGGVLAALASANPAWIAASVILGGAAGGVIGEYLSRQDAEKHASTQYRALETLGKDETMSWTNPETGHNGSTTVHDVFQMADGTTCKNFTETIYAGDQTVKDTATACKAPGGNWEVRGA